MDSVWVFFYGSFMSAAVLRKRGVECEMTSPARLEGFRLSIRPLANLSKDESSVAYGGLALVSHLDLQRLYAELKDEFDITYHPFPIAAELEDGNTRTALCYRAFDVPGSAADPDYIAVMAKCAAELEAPDDYIRHIESFAD